jgi:hypothetical protein
MVAAVASKTSAKAAWDTIKTMRVGDERVRESMAQQLLRQFEATEFKEGETMEDFSMRLSGMVQHLATLEEIVEEPKVVSKFLQCMPHRYRQIVVAINTLLDIKTLSLVNVTRRLKAAEDDLEAPPASVNHAGKMYLSEEAWEEKWKLREGFGSGGGSSSRGGGRGGRGAKRGRGRGFGGNDRESARSSPSGPGKVGRDQCRKCRKKGHWARDCKSKPKKDVAYTTQEESLMLVTAMPEIQTNGEHQAAVAQDGAVTHLVHLYEQKVFMQLGRREEHDH